jgi:predicted RNA-binding protein with PUA-like domain
MAWTGEATGSQVFLRTWSRRGSCRVASLEFFDTLSAQGHEDALQTYQAHCLQQRLRWTEVDVRGVRASVEHLGLPTASAHLAPARGPPRSAGC